MQWVTDEIRLCLEAVYQAGQFTEKIHQIHSDDPQLKEDASPVTCNTHLMTFISC